MALRQRLQVLDIESKFPGDFSKIHHLVKGSNYRDVFHESGDLEKGVWSAGMVMALIDDIPSCEELLTDITSEAEDIIRSRMQKALI